MSPCSASDLERIAANQSHTVQDSPVQKSDRREQEDGESPSKDAIVRPGTPDAYLECHVSPCSLSVSDAPSHTLELDQAGLEDAAITLTGLNGSSIGKHGTDVNGVAAPVLDIKVSLPTRQPQVDNGSSAVPEPTWAVAQHRRGPSNLSIAESEISSSGTFIDKGSCEELGKEDKSEEPSTAEAASEDDKPAALGQAEAESQEGLKPPESAFSTSDISEQLSGAVQEEDGLHCITCKVTATSEEQLAIHKEGKKHRRHLAIAELQGSPLAGDLAEGGNGQDLHCNLCQVTAPTPQHREYHLRGQKHQRRKKQHQLMEASAEVASSSVNALLTDSDSETEAPEAIAADEAAVARAEDEASSSPAEIDGSDQRPLKSPFEEFAPSKTAAPKPLLPPPQSHRSVRFNGGLQSFSEEPDDVTDEYGPNPPLPPHASNLSASSYKLISGGSFSSPAAHYCPVCGIIATSEANLEDHYQGRRHARRLQYLSHMPDVERNEQLQRTLTAASSGLFRQGSLVLPSSMDLTAYIGAVAQVHPVGPPPAPLSIERAASLRACRSLNKTLSNQQLSWDSVNGLHLHREEPKEAGDKPGEPAEAGKQAEEEASGSDSERQGGGVMEHTLEPQPKCEICGITTTSQAHMEAHKAGRKHRRRVEAAAGRSTVKSSAHYCPLCEISTTSSAHLALHLVGRAHRRRQKALEDGESLHPVSLLPAAAASETLGVQDECGAESRSNGDAVSSAEGQGSGALQAGAAGETDGNDWAEGHRGAPPLSGRAHSQPEARNNGLYTADTSRLTGTRTQSAELKPDAKPPHARSMAGSRPPMPPSMAPMGLPHSGYPVGMYPYAHPYFPQGSVSPYPPGPGGHPNYNWWPGAVHSMPQQQFHPRPQFQEGVYHPMSQYPSPYTGAPPKYPMMGVPLAVNFSGIRPPSYPTYDQQQRKAAGAAAASPRDWQSQQDMYNCEVCNVQTEKLDDLKHHLRGKQHKRRLYNPTKGAWM